MQSHYFSETSPQLHTPKGSNSLSKIQKQSLTIEKNRASNEKAHTPHIFNSVQAGNRKVGSHVEKNDKGISSLTESFE
jgi:hypothetical protein